MKILLIGGNGQLGSDLLRNNVDHEILAPPRAKMDVERPADVERIMHRFEPELVINCAAFHRVPLCETEPEQAFRTNCVAVRDLARLCRDRDIGLVTFSSDYVFGGEQTRPYEESACPHPVQVYGITRLAGEHAARSVAPEHAIIVRTCGLYGVGGSRSKNGNFVDQRVADAARVSEIEMSCEQIVGPTSTNDLSKAVWQLIQHPLRESGIYHLVNEGECSWYEFTRAIFEALEELKVLDKDVKVRPVNRNGLSGQMRRPLYSVLANTRAGAMGIRLPPWRDALYRYLQIKYAETS